MSLVTVAEQLGFMREPQGGSEEDLLQTILDRVEAQLQTQCNRVDIPFKSTTQSARVEYHDGTGWRILHLHYPISAITSIKLGLDPSSPDDTLDPTDKTVVRFDVGSRRLVRVDGGRFGLSGTPLYVQVTYDAQADREEELEAARLAIMHRTAALWRQRGLEGMVSAGQSDVRAQVDRDLDTSPHWKDAIAACRRMNVI